MFPLLSTKPVAPQVTKFIVWNVLETQVWPNGEEVVIALGSLFIQPRVPGQPEVEVEGYSYAFVTTDSDEVVEGHTIHFTEPPAASDGSEWPGWYSGR